MLNISQNFTIQDIKDDFQGLAADIESDLVEALFESGKAAVDKARIKTKVDKGFGNITWDLRASIGCVLVNRSQILPEHIYFPPIAQSDQGEQAGINYAREIALLLDDGEPMLIFVAGMDYAAFVEAKGYDVISMSCEEIEVQFKSLVK